MGVLSGLELIKFRVREHTICVRGEETEFAFINIAGILIVLQSILPGTSLKISWEIFLAASNVYSRPVLLRPENLHSDIPRRRSRNLPPYSKHKLLSSWYCLRRFLCS